MPYVKTIGSGQLTKDMASQAFVFSYAPLFLGTPLALGALPYTKVNNGRPLQFICEACTIVA